MIQSRLLVFPLVLLAALAAVPAWGQAAPRAQAAVDVVLIDVGAIFKEHPYFNQRMKELQADAETAESQVKKERDQLRNMMDELGRIKAGTEEYKNFEAQVFEFKNRLETKVQLQRKELLQREAKIYHQAYQEIQREVEAFAATNSISVVLKFNRETPDPEKPDEILRDLNRPVLFYAKHLDITNYIIDGLKKNMANPVSPASRPSVPPRR